MVDVPTINSESPVIQGSKRRFGTYDEELAKSRALLRRAELAQAILLHLAGDLDPKLSGGPGRLEERLDGLADRVRDWLEVINGRH